jgi:hypothetical protein
MANLTITVDDDLLRRAQIRALEQETSINRLLREYLEAFATGQTLAEGLQEVLDTARRSTSRSGPEGRSWTREELHER